MVHCHRLKQKQGVYRSFTVKNIRNIIVAIQQNTLMLSNQNIFTQTTTIICLKLSAALYDECIYLFIYAPHNLITEEHQILQSIVSNPTNVFNMNLGDQLISLKIRLEVSQIGIKPSFGLHRILNRDFQLKRKYSLGLGLIPVQETYPMRLHM